MSDDLKLDNDTTQEPPKKRGNSLLFGKLPFELKQDEDDDGSGGKQAQLKRSPAEEEQLKRLFLQELEETLEAEEKHKLEEREREVKHQQQIDILRQYQLQKPLQTKDAFSAANINGHHATQYISGTASGAVALGAIAATWEHINFAQIVGSISSTVAGQSGKSITAMIDQKPVETWHATQYFDPHAPSWAVAMNYNPHAPARHYVLTGSNATQATTTFKKQHTGKIKSALFSANTDSKSQQSHRIATNRFSGFNHQPRSASDTAAQAPEQRLQLKSKS